MDIHLLATSPDLPLHICQPYKQQQGLDPVVPLTPAPTKITQQCQRQVLKTPIHPSSFYQVDGLLKESDVGVDGVVCWRLELVMEGLGFNLCVVPSHLDHVLNFR